MSDSRNKVASLFTIKSVKRHDRLSERGRFYATIEERQINHADYKTG